MLKIILDPSVEGLNFSLTARYSMARCPPSKCSWIWEFSPLYPRILPIHLVSIYIYINACWAMLPENVVKPLYMIWFWGLGLALATRGDDGFLAGCNVSCNSVSSLKMVVMLEVKDPEWCMQLTILLTLWLMLSQWLVCLPNFCLACYFYSKGQDDSSHTSANHINFPIWLLYCKHYSNPVLQIYLNYILISVLNIWKHLVSIAT